MSGWSHVELTAGFVTTSAIEDAGGIHEVTTDGTFQFFIEVVGHNGERLGLSSSRDYGNAIEKAEAAALDWQCPVHDRVAEGI
ncbi:MAG TPA: hypothetical protein VGN98_00850 [Tianweitania sediminis]|nr:hypothetical protein [Tianweitania sediminis]